MTHITIEREEAKRILHVINSGAGELRQLGLRLAGKTLEQALAAPVQPVQEGSCGHESCDCRSYCKKQQKAQPAAQDVAAYLFTNVQSEDIESSTDPDHKQDERELWYREELVRQHHHTKKGRP